MSWILEEKGFEKGLIEKNGNKFIIGNGYMGYRGTLEEFSSKELVACNMPSLYDKVQDKWGENVNVPNGLLTNLICNNKPVNVINTTVNKHVQGLRLDSGVHYRETEFHFEDEQIISLESERFASFYDIHSLISRVTISVTKTCELVIETGIDGQVWDINGPHLENFEYVNKNNMILVNSRTQQLKKRVTTAEAIDISFGVQEIIQKDNKILRKITVKCIPGTKYCFTKYVNVYIGSEAENPEESALEGCIKALEEGYEKHYDEHIKIFNRRWDSSNIEINGDERAQLALRYSIYQLLILAPTHTDKASIPARGLSGQVYKGAIFWDTEMFMLPFYTYTDPKVARNLLMYRYHTLNGARKKAKEYSFRGAFYAWESQDTGEDACTLFNITDVFTNRPMRTYFRDKQVHISADIPYAIYQYVKLTGDESILLEGGAEVILECARFFYSYAYYKREKKRYEILDVTGPDEYHERVNNNAFTNKLVKKTLEIALDTLKLLHSKYKIEYEALLQKLDFHGELESIKEMYSNIYIPMPAEGTNLIEQFDGYSKLEEITLKELKERVINPNEYFGGGNGLATTTKILKQADVVLMLNLFKEEYPEEVKKANWDYYEPITEHGSSLSPCVYALLATDIGYTEWAYKYFLKTAEIDLTGESKQYVGTLYIGGTHPAANGGAWMVATFGFGGLSGDKDNIILKPYLPESWEELIFPIQVEGQSFKIKITKTAVEIKGEEENSINKFFMVNETKVIVMPGEVKIINLI